MRGIAIGRRNWTFCGSDAGGRRAWLADVLARIATHPMSRIGELMPWSWKATRLQHAQAA